MKNPNYLFLVAILAITSFFLYGFFETQITLPLAASHDQQMIYSWPDAMANYFFIQNFNISNTWAFAEPLNTQFGDIFHPRSTNIINHFVVPSGFPGMIVLFGLILKILPFGFINFLTPILGALSLFPFFGVTRIVFGQKTAIIGVFLLAFFAPFVYYANLSMLSAVPFVFCTLVGLYFFLKFLMEKYDYLNAIASAVFFGLAFFIRPCELIWLFAIILLNIILLAKKSFWRQILVFAIVFFMISALFPLFNHIIYGKWWMTGYFNATSSNLLSAEFQIQEQQNGLAKLFRLAFIPFGLHLRNIYNVLIEYVISPLWPYFCLTVSGLVYLGFKIKKNKFFAAYVFSFILSNVWLLFYYGNWILADNLILKNNIIGSSYTRYLLPGLILALPIVSYFIHLTLEIKARNWLKKLLLASIILGLSMFSLNIAFYSPKDGLLAQKDIIKNYYDQFDLVFQKIQPNAILIVDRTDKIFFPSYRVVPFNFNYNIFHVLRNALKDRAIYYHSVLSAQQIKELNEEKLQELGLKFELYALINSEYSLYTLKTIK